MILKHKKNPLLFQGNKKNKKYFEGWYFKQVSFDLKNIVSIIPGISKGCGDPHAFIQIIISNEHNGKTLLKTYYHKVEIKDFKYTDEPFCLTIGKNSFSNNGIELNLTNEEYSIKGSIRFSEFTEINRRMFSPTACICQLKIRSKDHSILGHFFVNKCASENCTKAQ